MVREIRFDGFPYILTKIVGAMYHVALLPKDLSVSEMTELAHLQVLANRLPTCLVLSEKQCLYFSPENGKQSQAEPPWGGIWIVDKLQLSQDFDDCKDLRLRRRKLDVFMKARNPTSGYMVCTARANARDATPEEKVLLAGSTADGIPKGLSRCPTCSEYKGTCFPLNDKLQNEVLQVHCQCENWNRCARCGETLSENRLNANHYITSRKGIFHHPGFSCFSHKCKSAVPVKKKKGNRRTRT